MSAVERLIGRRMDRKRLTLTFSITVTYESNEDYDRDGLTVGDSCKPNEYGKLFNAILKVPDEVIRQQSEHLFTNMPTKSARLFATRKVKLFFQSVTRQPQKIIYDARKNLPYWRKVVRDGKKSG